MAPQRQHLLFETIATTTTKQHMQTTDVKLVLVKKKFGRRSIFSVGHNIGNVWFFFALLYFKNRDSDVIKHIFGKRNGNIWMAIKMPVSKII